MSAQENDTLPSVGDDRPFEGIVSRLSEIVSQLEKGEVPLERALALFEEGVALSRSGSARLDAAELRVEELLAANEQGRVRTRPLDASGQREPR